MFKKALLVLFLLLSSLFSDVSLGVIGNHAYVEFDTIEEFSADQGKNWVAIYKKGDSTDWDNVLRWAWITDLPSHGEKTYDFKFDDLDSEGLYELRFFYANSYVVHQSVLFEFTSGSASFIQVVSHDGNTLQLISSNIDLNTNSWIGIFEKDKSNDWDNVMGWSWVDSVTSNDKDYKSTIKDLTLADGVYDIRLFYNNSFEEEASVELVVDDNDISLEFSDSYSNGLLIHFQSSKSASQSWIGIYEKEKSHDWDNVKLWKWISVDNKGRNRAKFRSSEYRTLDAHKTYEARLFFNNSFKKEASVEFSIPIPNLIRGEFLTRENYTGLHIYFSTGRYLSVVEKDWLGIFKKGVPKTAENILYKAYVSGKVREIPYSSQRRYIFYGIENEFETGEYEAVLFEKDTYNILSSVEFSKTD